MVTINCNFTIDWSSLSAGDTVSAYPKFAVSALQQDSAIDAERIAVGLKAWNGSTLFDTRWAFNYFRGPNVERSRAYRVPVYVIPALTMIIELRGGQKFSFDRAGIYNKARLG